MKKNFFFLIFIHKLLVIFCQDNANKNTKQTTSPNQYEQDPQNENVDNSLVFNALFEELKEQWSKKMIDFVSQYIYLVPVPYKTQVDFYENITKVPCIMSGAFLLEEANSQKDIIDFKIIAPNKTTIFQSSSIGSIFKLNLTDKGLYKILLFLYISRIHLIHKKVLKHFRRSY